MRSSLRLLPTLGLSLLVGGMSACGNPGAPEPPSLLLPVPVKDLAAQRTNDTVSLTWTMSTRTTDRLLLKNEQTIAVCRAVGKSPCKPIGETEAYPGTAAHFDDSLPPELTGGPARLLSYDVQLKNHAGRDAGPSNLAYAATGAAPPSMQGVVAEATAKGILIHWNTSGTKNSESLSGAKLTAVLTRDRVLRKGESAKPSRAETNAGVPQPLQQSLVTQEAVIHGDWSPAQTLDTNALLNRTYRYTVQLEQKEQVGGQTITVFGSSATSAALDARDIFPPDVPESLYAAANPQGAAIDLSWAPDSSLDTAGYFVYRRATGDAGRQPVRISGRRPVETPAWSDSSAKEGVRYSYSVSAIDASGNESARSKEVLAALPAANQPGQSPQ
jgi:hypothetical protein